MSAVLSVKNVEKGKPLAQYLRGPSDALLILLSYDRDRIVHRDRGVE